MRAYASPCIGTGWHLYRCPFNDVAYWPFLRCARCRQIVQRDHIGAVMSYLRLYPPPARKLM